MTLESFTASLPKGQQFKLAIRLTRLALPIWENYADKHKLSYRDTVVGLKHTVNRELLQETIDAVETFSASAEIGKVPNENEKPLELYNQFTDPVVALQDEDWELPDMVLKTFYSVYNLIGALLGEEQNTSGESTLYVSINQAADALESSETLSPDEINRILEEINI